MFSFFRKPAVLPSRQDALPGRNTPMPVPTRHAVSGAALQGPWPAGARVAYFGLGCFWGAERKFWQIPGVISTAVGYQGGFTPNPTYEETCTGQTGHTEVVQVVYDPSQIAYEALPRTFWETHDPTQGMRQGNDHGTTYRSAIYTTEADQLAAAAASREDYQKALSASGHAGITTEIAPAGAFYFAEAYHQQYLAKNPDGYCGLGGTGVSCPIGVDLKS